MYTRYDSSCAMGLKSSFVKFIYLSNKEGYFSVFQNTRIEDSTKNINRYIASPELNVYSSYINFHENRDVRMGLAINGFQSRCKHLIAG